MKLHFLGTGAGNFRGSRRFPSSALLDGLLFDCGAGATGRLHDLRAFESVDAILISHLHTDHVAGISDFLLHTLITGRTKPLTLVSPPGLGRILRAIFEAHGTVVEPSQLYEFRLVEGDRIDLTMGRWHIRTVPLDHSVPNLGYHVSDGALSVFYTGDTREPSGALGLTADVLVHEATFSDDRSSLAREYGHSTGTEAARAALAMKARRLFLNHIGDQPGLEVEIQREARAVFPDATVVEDCQSVDL